MCKKTILFLISAWFLASSVSAQEKAAKPKFELPDDPKAVVIRLDVRLPNKFVLPEDPSINSTTTAKNSDSKTGDSKTGDTKTGDTKTGNGKTSTPNKTVPKKPLTIMPRKNAFDVQELDLPKKNDQQKKSTDKKPSELAKQDKKQDPKKTETSQDPNSKKQTVNNKPIVVPTRTFVTTQPDDPLIEILADGTVNCGRLNAAALPASSKLTPEQLQELLSFIIEKHKFFEIDDKKSNEFAATQNKVDPRNFARFKLTVNTKSKQVSKEIAGIRTLSRIFRDKEDLGHMAAIDKRLNQLFIAINVGGRENMAAILKAVNEQLKKRYKDAPMFGVGDASFITVYGRGAMRVTFGKSAVDEKGNVLYRYVATYRYQQGRANVAVYGFKN